MITATGISFSYGQDFHLRCASFVAKERCLTCIVGANGSGKTTFLRVLAGEERPLAGVVSFWKEDAAVDCAIGWVDVADSQLLVDDLYVADHLALVRHIRGDSVPVFHRKVGAEAIPEHAPGLRGSHNRKVAQISAGQRQLLAIELALQPDKQVLLCDEVTAHLDPRNSRLLWERLQGSADTNSAAVVVVTHNLLLAAEFASATYVVADGCVSPVEIPAGSDISGRIFALEAAMGILNSV